MEEKINECENMVLVSLDEYRSLIENANELDILLSAILSSAKLNYSEDGLRFSDEHISTIVSAISPKSYEIKFAKLKKEKEIKNESVD